jgi:PAS domain S-box-containing protein
MELNLNKLLARQIKRQFGSVDSLPTDLHEFIKNVNQTYNDFDADNRLIQNSIEISSQELKDALHKQKLDAETQREIIRKIKDVIHVLKPNEQNITDQNQHNQTESTLLLDSLIKIIDERKQAEAELIKLKIAVEQSSSTIVITDTIGNIQYTNKKFKDTTGYSIEEAIGKNPRILKSNETKPEMYHELWMTILAGNEWHGEFHNKRKDGTLYWEYASISPIRNSVGEIISFLAVKDDITERKRVEDALQAKTSILEAQTNATIDAILIVDMNQKRILINQRAIELFEIPENIAHDEDDTKLLNHVVGMTKFPDQFIEKVQYLYNHPNETGSDEIEFKNGKILDRYSAPVLGKDNEYFGRIWTFRDITKSRKAEKALQRSETLLRSIMDTTTDVIFVKDCECRFEYINPAGCKINGKTQEHLIGYSKADFISDPKELAKFMADDMRIIQEGKTEVFEEDVLGADAKLYTYLTTKVPRYDGQGNIIGLIGVAHDITEAKKAVKDLEQLSTRLSLATRAGGVGVWDYDLMNNTLIWDEQMFSLYGISRNEFNGAYEAWKSGLHPDDVERSDAEIQMAISGEKEFDTEFRVIWPDGSEHTIKALAILQRNEAGQPLRLIGTNWDITEKKLNEEKLIKAVASAEAANKAKSEFLANMSHEIRTPLNGVIGFTDLLKNTTLSALQEQYVKNANTSGYALLGIINDILDFSKIEAGMLELEITKTDMIELFGHSVDIIKYAADKKKLEVLLDIDPQMPRFAFVDSVRLKQIFANLLGNAVKFTEKGEIELKVTYKELNNNKGLFSFSVRDTGIGITEEQQKKLFKVFSQADSSTTRKFGGTGLGLVISEMIAHKMGSQIQIKSQQGKGSTFYFEIITDVEYGDMMDKTAINAVNRCLIIDDNSNNRVILEHTLTNWGIHSVSCDNGLDALKIIETSELFDLVICDYHMPYIDGLETIRMIREKLNMSPEKLPVILLHSSSDDEELHRKCEELGVRFMITKPVIANELFDYLVQLNSRNKSIEISVNKDMISLDHKKTATILIAEDNDFNMTLVKAMIYNIFPNVQIIEAVNGYEAYLFWKQIQPDLILMDIQMPELNGLEATQQIRILEKESGKHTPIIALTAGALKEEQENCFNAGMDNYLTKPINTDLLAEVINKYMS